MSEYAVIVQNDESDWDDVKGDIYHYPKTYRNILTHGCRIVYYKGRMTNKNYLPHRLSPEPHYFGVGIVGDSIEDPASSKGDLFCEILEYREFKKGVPYKQNDEYLEEIPESKKTNYWRFGVREIGRDVYERIMSLAKVGSYEITLPGENNEFESFDEIEGKKRKRYSSYYERNPFYRNKALEIHGFNCTACGFNFEGKYGDHGRGFIHVHHNKPISETGPTRINPHTDLSILCPNCHAMVHRKSNHTLSVSELKRLIRD